MQGPMGNSSPQILFLEGQASPQNLTANKSIFLMFYRWHTTIHSTLIVQFPLSISDGNINAVRLHSPGIIHSHHSYCPIYLPSHHDWIILHDNGNQDLTIDDSTYCTTLAYQNYESMRLGELRPVKALGIWWHALQRKGENWLGGASFDSRLVEK